jgi:predicted MFS family arabinose efflux permease
LANITISFNFAALAAVIPVMSHDLARSEILVSRISAYYMIPYGVGALLYAPLARYWSFKVILIVAMTVYAFLNFLCAGINSIGVILSARVVMGLAAAGVIPLCLISIGSVFERETRGRLVGLFFSTSFMASVAGLVLSGIGHWRWLFLIPGLLAVVTAILLMFLADVMIDRQGIVGVDYGKIWRNRDIRNILLFIFSISFLYHGVHKWLGVYLHQQYHLNQTAISSYFILIALSGAVGQNLGGYITDRGGRFAACYWGVLILAVSTMFLLGKHPLFFLAVILAAFSIGWTIGHNGVSTVLTDFPDETRSEIASLNSSVRFVSGGLGFFFGGPFVERDFGLTFFGFGVLMFAASIFLRNVIPRAQFMGRRQHV